MSVVNRCARCEKSVYPTEELKCLDKVWHKLCFKCQECGMTLNMKTYKGFNKLPYCNAHTPVAKHTTVADTPETRRLAENTKLQSQAKYHEEFERNMKGKASQLADDPELQRLKQTSKIISNVEYHRDIEKKRDMENRRKLVESLDDLNEQLVDGEPFDQLNDVLSDMNISDSRFSGRSREILPPAREDFAKHTFEKQEKKSFMGNPQDHYQQPNRIVESSYNGVVDSNTVINRPYGNETQVYPVSSSMAAQGLPQIHQIQSRGSQQFNVMPQPRHQTQSFNRHNPPQSYYQESKQRQPSGPTSQQQYRPQQISQNIPSYMQHMPSPGISQAQGGLQNTQPRNVQQSNRLPANYHNQQHLQSQSLQHPPQQQQSYYQNQNGFQDDVLTAKIPQAFYQQQNQPSGFLSQPHIPTALQGLRGQYRAIYDYKAQDHDEVSFLDGDVIEDCFKIDEGWILGRVGRTGQRGMIPANYVEPA